MTTLLRKTYLITITKNIGTAYAETKRMSVTAGKRDEIVNRYYTSFLYSVKVENAPLGSKVS